MIRTIKGLMGLPIGYITEVGLDGITVSINRGKYGYRITVKRVTDLYPMIQEGESSVISRAYIEDVQRHGYDFQMMCAYYNGYNPRITVHELILFDIVLGGLLYD